jgi:hypothetical protein
MTILRSDTQSSHQGINPSVAALADRIKDQTSCGIGSFRYSTLRLIII